MSSKPNMEAINATAQNMEHSLALHLERILIGLGQDASREGLRETPERYIKFLKQFLSPAPVEFKYFDAEKIDEMIIVTDIYFYSLCEHHLAPFFGTAAVAYIPTKKIVGLSKIPRTVEYYASRLQNQERLTCQIADRIQSELEPAGVAVYIKAEHLCMAMRGIKKPGSKTHTSKLLGVFKEDDKARNEFLSFIREY